MATRRKKEKVTEAPDAVSYGADVPPPSLENVCDAFKAVLDDITEQMREQGITCVWAFVGTDMLQQQDVSRYGGRGSRFTQRGLCDLIETVVREDLLDQFWDAPDDGNQEQTA